MIPERFRKGYYAGNKWGGKFLRAPEIFYTILKKGKGKLVRLGDIAEVRRGFTTGANDFFYLPSKYFDIKEEGDYYRLIPKRDNLPRDIKIEKEFLKPVIKSPRECKTIIIKPEDLKHRVFICNKSKRELKGTGALKYIEWGEKQVIEIKRGGEKGKKIKGFHRIETVKNRKYWYSLPKLPSADVLFRQFFNEIFNYPINPNNFLTDHTFYYIHLTKNKDKIYHIGISLNNVVAWIFTEIYGRQNMGEGVLTTYGPEMRPLPVIDPNYVRCNISKIINGIFKREIKSIFEELGFNPSKPIREQEPNPLPDRAELDNIIFNALGLTEEERKEVYWAVAELVKQRLEKAKSLKKKKGE